MDFLWQMYAAFPIWALVALAVLEVIFWAFVSGPLFRLINRLRSRKK